ncbi:MAG: hypothetical protein V1847_00830 [Candidatus Diapherotrites archaeon]
MPAPMWGILVEAEQGSNSFERPFSVKIAQYRKEFAQKDCKFYSNPLIRRDIGKILKNEKLFEKIRNTHAFEVGRVDVSSMPAWKLLSTGVFEPFRNLHRENFRLLENTGAAHFVEYGIVQLLLKEFPREYKMQISPSATDLRKAMAENHGRKPPTEPVPLGELEKMLRNYLTREHLKFKKLYLKHGMLKAFKIKEERRSQNAERMRKKTLRPH